MKSELIVTIKNREPENKKQVRQFFDVPDGKYLFTRERKDKRSLDQNAYYWKIVVPLIKHRLRDMGYDEVRNNKHAHELLKYRFLAKAVVNKETGEVIGEILGSTADLNKQQFSEYLESIWKWAAEKLEITIPSPGEQASMFKDFKAT